MAGALILGVVLAVACLGYVLYPLVRSPWGSRAEPASSRAGASRRGALRDVTDDEIEQAVRAYRARHLADGVCRKCGPRPESDAVYCSSCGRQLNPAEGAAPG